MRAIGRLERGRMYEEVEGKVRKKERLGRNNV